MQLDWFTFALEVANFLVLVWILQHFLYRPILATIARRRTAIEKALADASAGKTRAEELERQYRERLSAWEKEKATLRVQALAEVDEERKRRVVAMQAEADREAERRHAIEQRQGEELRRKMAGAALANATRFAAALMGRLASPALEGRLLSVMLEDLAGLPEDRRDALAGACREAGSRIAVTSAFPLPDPARAALVEGFRSSTGVTPEAAFIQDPALVTGLRVSVGPLVLHANIADELAFFAERVADGR